MLNDELGAFKFIIHHSAFIIMEILMTEQTAQSKTSAARRPYGQIFIIAERCKGCAFCVEFCPKDILAMSEQFNGKGYHVPMVLEEGTCTDCKLCQLLCPEFAIYIVRVEGVKE
jgi:2-oxoglutarate ferredoxin oxidoreductase subunit delta